MGRGAAAPATVVIGTVKILDIVIALVEVVIQVVTAIRAYQQAAEHIPFPRPWVFVCGFSLVFPEPVPRSHDQ